jgi:hypothetical protein
MSNRIKIVCALLLVAVVIAGVSAIRAQQVPKSWEIWHIYFDNQSFPRAQVYKIQDGQCSLYVALGYAGNTQPIAIATGQGCK